MHSNNYTVNNDVHTISNLVQQAYVTYPIVHNVSPSLHLVIDIYSRVEMNALNALKDTILAMTELTLLRI